MAKEAKRVVVGGNIKCRCGCEDLLIACLIDDDDGRQKASFRRLAIHECVTNGNEPIPRKSIFSARHSGDTQIPSRHSAARSKEESSQCLRQNNNPPPRRVWERENNLLLPHPRAVDEQRWHNIHNIIAFTLLPHALVESLYRTPFIC